MRGDVLGASLSASEGGEARQKAKGGGSVGKLGADGGAWGINRYYGLGYARQLHISAVATQEIECWTHAV